MTLVSRTRRRGEQAMGESGGAMTSGIVLPSGIRATGGGTQSPASQPGIQFRTVIWNTSHRLPRPISTCMAHIIWMCRPPKSGTGNCVPYGQRLRCS